MRNISKERLFSGLFFMAIAVLTAVDIFEDYQEGAELGHIGLELSIAILALLAAFYLFKKMNDQRLEIIRLEKQKQILEDIGAKMKNKSKIFIQGLHVQIDQEFGNWKLSPGEKEVGLFLLKGLTTTEISELRGSAEKTVRHQMTSIYKKAGIKNRHEFQAYFLEDLLAPQEEVNE